MKLFQLFFFAASRSSAQLYGGYPSVGVFPEQQMYFPTQQVIFDMPSFGMPPTVEPSFGMPPMVEPSFGMPPMVEPSFGLPPMVEMAQPAYGTAYGMPAGINLPPVYADTSILPQAAPALNMFAGSDIPHPSVIAEEQRKNIDKARQNLELKIKEMTESSEQQKKSVADQANQQMQQYAKSLEDQVQRTQEAADMQLKASIDGYVRTIKEYEERLQAQAAHTLSLYREKLMREATEKAQLEYKTQESHARAELEEQTKSARSYAQGGSGQESSEWLQRAHARYSEQIQQLQQAMQANIQKASEEIASVLKQPEVAATQVSDVVFSQQATNALDSPQTADSLPSPEAPAALAMSPPADLDDTN